MQASLNRNSRLHHAAVCALIALALTAAGTRPTAAALGDITLVGHLTFPTTTRITNVWGYIDQTTHKEYALVGDWTGGFFIVDVSNPALPVQVSKVTAAPGFDLKPWGRYVYSCDGNASGRDGRITNIASPASPVVVPATYKSTFQSCHTITLSTRGHMYTEYVGVTIYDLVNNPEEPDSLYKIFNFGHDSTWRHNRLYDFNWEALNIWDMTNPRAPVLVGSNDDPTIQSYHSGDESKSGNYLYVCDELAVTPTPDMLIFNITNPAAPARIGYINDSTSSIHQLYVVKDLMFVAYYNSGFKTFILTNPAAPMFADQYDTSIYQSETSSDAFNGAYGVYPYAPSGIVYVSDHPNGLYLFSVEGHTNAVTGVGGAPKIVVALAQNQPNPFNPHTTIAFELSSSSHARVAIYDVRGAHVRTLVDGDLGRGAHTVDWNGEDDAGRLVSSGVYYYRLTAGDATATRRMVLLK